MEELEKLINSAVEGVSSPFKAKLELDKMEALLDKLKADLKPILIKEAQKYPEKTFTIDGMKVERREGRKVFDFSGIDKWKEAKETIKGIEDESKMAFSLYEKGKQAINDDGEILQIPSVKYTDDVVIVKVDKK